MICGCDRMAEGFQIVHDPFILFEHFIVLGKIADLDRFTNAHRTCIRFDLADNDL